jgi:hypothetical protein
MFFNERASIQHLSDGQFPNPHRSYFASLLEHSENLVIARGKRERSYDIAALDVHHAQGDQPGILTIDVARFHFFEQETGSSIRAKRFLRKYHRALDGIFNGRHGPKITQERLWRNRLRCRLIRSSRPS